MSNLIQIKRSTTSAAPGSLANGELAFTSAGDVLYIGSPNGSIIAIGGVRTPGILSANQALVANSTSGINEIRVGVANVGAIYANGTLGSSGQILASNSTGVFWKTPDAVVSGSDTQVQFNDNGTLAGDSGLTFNKTTDTLSTNNVFATGVVNALSLSVGTSIIANTSRLVIGTGVGVQANGEIGSSGQILTSNGSTVYWGDAGGSGTVTSVDAGNGLVTNDGFPITGAGSLSVLANNGIIANTSGVFVRAGTGVTVNATGVHIGQAVETTSDVTFRALSTTGNTALGDAASDVVSINGVVNTAILPLADLVYNIGSPIDRWANIYVGVLHSNGAFFDNSVQISGNLSVLGTTFTVSANNLVVDDSMIQLAANNNTSDLLDIGFFGNYNGDGGVHEHAGLFRDASDDTFKLFKGLQDTPTATVNTAGTGYTLATLQSYLNSGGLVTSSSAVNITANSTVAVSITANTLSLTTALPGTSGGTGRLTTTSQALLVGNTTNGYNELVLGTSGYVLQSNGTALVYDVLDGGTF